MEKQIIFTKPINHWVTSESKWQWISWYASLHNKGTSLSTNCLIANTKDEVLLKIKEKEDKYFEKPTEPVTE